MITQCAKLTWRTSSSVSKQELHHLVTQVRELGGQFLIYEGNYINVIDVMAHWALYRQHAQETLSLMSQLNMQGSMLGGEDVAYLTCRMHQKAVQTGRLAAQYAASLGCINEFLRRLPGLPEQFKSESSLRPLFHKGFEMDCAAVAYEQM